MRATTRRQPPKTKEKRSFTRVLGFTALVFVLFLTSFSQSAWLTSSQGDIGGHVSVKSVSEPVGTGTRSAPPSSLPFIDSIEGDHLSVIGVSPAALHSMLALRRGQLQLHIRELSSGVGTTRCERRTSRWRRGWCLRR